MVHQCHPWEAGSGSESASVGKAVLRTQKERVHTYGVDERLEDPLDFVRRMGPVGVVELGVMFMRSRREAIVGCVRGGERGNKKRET